MGCCGILINGIKRIVSPPGQTPLDPKIMTTIFVVNVANAMMITMPFSFLPKMMRSFGIEEKRIGYNVGLVASSLYAGRAIGSYLWGWLCDNVGRKSAMLMSEALLLVCTVLFGLSGSLSWAIAVRFCQGAFGGVIIALKATVFALCDETNNSLGMAIVLSSFQIGLTIGPAIGGYLVYPADKYPNTFSKDSLFGKFPFLFPILINGIVLAIGIVMTIFMVPETLKKNGEGTTLLKNGSIEKSPPAIETSLSKSRKKSFLDMCAYEMILSKESYTVLSVKPKDKTSNNDTDFDEDAVSVSHFQLANDSHIYGRSISVRTSKCCKSLKESSVWKLLRIKAVQISLWLYFIFSFITIGFDEIFPVFADSSKAYGGLEFSSSEIGTSILFAALPMIVLIFLVARLTQRFGDKIVLISTLYIMMFGLPLFPYIALVPSSYVWYVLLPFLLLQRFSMSTGFLAVNVLLNESASAEYVGLVNGLGMIAASIARAASPSILGALYSWSLRKEGRLGYPFNHCFPFVLIGFFALLTLVIATFLQDKVHTSAFRIDTDSTNEDEISNESSHKVSTKI